MSVNIAMRRVLNVRRRIAFSLLELMAVVTVLGVIAAILVPRVINSTDSAAEKACYRNRAHLNAQIERYSVDNGSYPTDMSELLSGGYFPEGIPTCPVSGGAYTIDGATHRISGHSNSGNH